MNRLDRGVNRIGARKRRRANPLATAVSALATLAVVLGLLYAMAGPDQPASADLSAQVVAALPTDTPRSTPTPSPTPTPVPTPVPTPEMLRAPELEALPTPEPAPRLAVEACDDAKPGLSKWRYQSGIYVKGKKVKDGYRRPEEIGFSDGSDYTELAGVITFRGSNLRQNAAYGTAALEQTDIEQLWCNKIGYIDSGYNTWTGVGWTGQPVLVRWPDELRRAMNLKKAYKDRSDLIEVIHGTLDGNIYFLDALTGKPTRDPIKLGFPIKGSVSIDPRGYPLLYVGQGISKANGKVGRIGWRVYSLLDQKQIYFLDGHDPLCFRSHGSFDGCCLLDAETDTILEGGENGIFYTIKLNTKYDPDAPSISIDPEVTAMRYKSAVSKELGIENSVAAYGGYAWFSDNSGLLTCIDVNTLESAWLFNLGDDTDATIALEPEADGCLALYTVNQVDKQGSSGKCTLRRLNALTGEEEWRHSVKCTSDGSNGGGGFASPAVGENAYDQCVYYNVCRTGEGGTLFCFAKKSGDILWQRSTGSASWSSPVLVYREDGTGALVLANPGRIALYDPDTGDRLGEIAVEGGTEGSPAVFDDILILGTRGCRIYGMRLT